MPKCGSCTKSRDKENMIPIIEHPHWAFPSASKLYCRECIEERGYDFEQSKNLKKLVKAKEETIEK